MKGTKIRDILWEEGGEYFGRFGSATLFLPFYFDKCFHAKKLVSRITTNKMFRKG